MPARIMRFWLPDMPYTSRLANSTRPLVWRDSKPGTHRRRDAQSRTRLHHKDAFGGQPYSAVGCMTEATTTLTRAGAHPESMAWWDTYDEFQSSPPEFGGRISRRATEPCRAECFNPRPPNSGGASGKPISRRCVGVTFQSSPPEFGGRIFAYVGQSAILTKFQSSPPEFGGRIRTEAYYGITTVRFNPRPPNSGGASDCQLAGYGITTVSILAPRIRGAHRLLTGSSTLLR